MKDERLVSKWKVKLFFSRRLKLFGGFDLTDLDHPPPLFYDISSTPLGT